MQATHDLIEEHEAIKVMLRVLDRVASRLENGEPVSMEHLEGMIDFIQGFTDRCHHAKEEDLLFVAMEQAGIPRDGGPIGVMLAEHKIGRDTVRSMAEAVRAYAAGDEGAGRRFTDHARQYVTLLTQHIEKEDSVLYPLADQHLTAEQQAALVEGFDRIEHEVVGHGKHEAYHHLLEELEQTYLQTA
ncbi:MAG TPA: hemerythrin [Chloroflexi bacterium]|jgi:hemerythrin-like domain-containing protein|nr:hemerythrin [Chloroflexota bacterium]